MGLKGFFDSVFEDSEEELVADIKEAEELIRERKKQLEALKRKRMKAKHDFAPKPKKKTSYVDYLCFIIPIVIAIIIIVIGLSLPAGQEKNHAIYCEGDPECTDCEIVLSCVGLTDYEVSFRLTNQLNADGNCIVDILFSQEDEMINKKTYAIGAVKSKETIKTSIPIEMPEGDTKISVIPTCEW